MTLKIQQSLSNFTKSIELCRTNLYSLNPSLQSSLNTIRERIENTPGNALPSQRENKVAFSPQEITLQCQNTTKQCVDLIQSFLQNAPTVESLSPEQNELQHQLQTLKNILNELKKCPQFNQEQKQKLEKYADKTNRALTQIQNTQTAIISQNTELKRRERREKGTFINLPPEAVCEILKFLDLSDLRSVALVCHFFNSTAQTTCHIKIRENFPNYAMDNTLSSLSQYGKAITCSNIAHGRYVEETIPISFSGGTVVQGNFLFANQHNKKVIEVWEVDQKNVWKKIQTLPVFAKDDLHQSLHYDGTYLFIIVNDKINWDDNDEDEDVTRTIQIWKQGNDNRFSQLQALTCISPKQMSFKEDLLILFPDWIGSSIQIWKKDEKDNFSQVSYEWKQNKRGDITCLKMHPSEVTSQPSVKNEKIPSNVELSYCSDGGYDGTTLLTCFIGTGVIWEKDPATHQFNFLQEISCQGQKACYLWKGCIFQFFTNGKFKIWKKNNEGRFALHQENSFCPPAEAITAIDFVAHGDHFVFTNSGRIVKLWEWDKGGYLIPLKTFKIPDSRAYAQFSNNRLFLTLEYPCHGELTGIRTFNFNVSPEKMLVCLAKHFKHAKPADSALPRFERFEAMTEKYTAPIRQLLKDMSAATTSYQVFDTENFFYLAIMKHVILRMSTTESFKLLADAFKQVKEGDTRDLNFHIQLLNQLIDSLPSGAKEPVHKYFNEQIEHSPKGFSEACDYLSLACASGMDLSLFQVVDLSLLQDGKG